MILAAHQPDLLPYTGFFSKMQHADVFCVLPWEQINHDGYTRRVRMMNRWASLALTERHTGQRISELALLGHAVQNLWDLIRGRYQGQKYWVARSETVREWIEEAAMCRRMWQFNLSLILSARDYLGITTPVAVPGPAEDGQDATLKLLALCHRAKADVYLSGTGAGKYLRVDYGTSVLRLGTVDDTHMHRPELRWSDHAPHTGDSILTTIFTRENPGAMVLNSTQSGCSHGIRLDVQSCQFCEPRTFAGLKKTP